MSDERLRELERRWKETGSVDDEAKYLAERVRVGDLTKERLELAAYCGSMAASLATGRKHVPAHPNLNETVTTIGQMLGNYAAIRSAWIALSVNVKWRESDSAALAVQAVSDWLGCPCELHRTKARSVSQQLGIEAQLPVSAWSSAFAAYELVKAVAETEPERSRERIQNCTQELLRAESDLLLRTPVSLKPINAMVQAIRAQMLAWALATCPGDSGPSQADAGTPTVPHP